jgi:hypothetical protein
MGKNGGTIEGIYSFLKLQLQPLKNEALLG